MAQRKVNFEKKKKEEIQRSIGEFILKFLYIETIMKRKMIYIWFKDLTSKFYWCKQKKKCFGCHFSDFIYLLTNDKKNLKEQLIIKKRICFKFKMRNVFWLIKRLKKEKKLIMKKKQVEPIKMLKWDLK